MARFPTDASKAKVIRAFESLGFRLVRETNHIVMVRRNPRRDENASNDAKPPNDKRFHITYNTYAGWHISR